MAIRAEQIHNVLRTYGHMDALKPGQTNKAGEASLRESHPEHPTLLDESFEHTNLQAES